MALIGEIRNAYKIFVGKPQGKRPIGRSSHIGRIILKYILKKYVRLGSSGRLFWTRQ
jgi:hypothetical protein